MSYPSVNFQPTSPFMGLQPIAQTSTTQAHVLGTVIRARDVSYGEGEFIYLLGLASTAAGDVVCFNSKTGVTVRAVEGGATSNGPVAIAMSANVAAQYGWYQLSGSGPVNAATSAANTQAYLSATDGQIDDTGTTVIAGMLIKAATSGGFATVQLDRPSINPGSGLALSLAAVGSAPSANGATLAAGVLTLQPADATHPGVLTIGAQTIAGIKTFGTGTYTVMAGDLYAQGSTTCTANVEITNTGAGLIFKSPNGTRYQLKVANDGTLSATAA